MVAYSLVVALRGLKSERSRIFAERDHLHALRAFRIRDAQLGLSLQGDQVLIVVALLDFPQLVFVAALREEVQRSIGISAADAFVPAERDSVNPVGDLGKRHVVDF